jgi:hypothetical protein
MTEQFSNNASTPLNGGINNVVTTIVVTNGTPFSQSGTFRILVESEIMLVTAIAGNTMTVVRGQEGTSAVSHLSGVTVSQIITAAGVQQLKQDVWNLAWLSTKTSNYSVLASDQGIPVDTTSGAITITLPSSPIDGERHLIADVSGTANTNNISVSGNGHTIVGLSTYIMTGQYNVLEVTYHLGKTVWMIT